MKCSVEHRDHTEQHAALPDLVTCHIENVTREQVLELFLSSRHTAQEENHPRRGDDESDADDCFLGNRGFPAASGPAEKRRAHERDAKRDPERYAVVEVMIHEERDAGAESGDLCESEIHENDLTLYD